MGTHTTTTTTPTDRFVGLDIGPDETPDRSVPLWRSIDRVYRARRATEEGKRGGSDGRSYAPIGKSSDYVGHTLTLAADLDPASLTPRQLERMADAILTDANMACPVVGYRFDSKAEVATFDPTDLVAIDVARHSWQADVIDAESAAWHVRKVRADRDGLEPVALPADQIAVHDVAAVLLEQRETGLARRRAAQGRWPMRTRIGLGPVRKGETRDRVETIDQMHTHTVRTRNRQSGRTVRMTSVTHLTAPTGDGRVWHGLSGPYERPMSKREREQAHKQKLAKVRQDRTVRARKSETFRDLVERVAATMTQGETRELIGPHGSIMLRWETGGRWSAIGTAPGFARRVRKTRIQSVLDLITT